MDLQEVGCGGMD